MLSRLVRHGQSQANSGLVDPKEIGDHNVALTSDGCARAEAIGRNLSKPWLSQALLYSSPYLRTRQTLDHMLGGVGLKRDDATITVYEDPRLREVEHGYDDYDAQQSVREIHGWFYYRSGGESPADCFDRTSGFIESLLRQAERKNNAAALIVTHGLTSRCFVMRFLHLSVEFESLPNPENCALITIGPAGSVADLLFERGDWAVSGLALRDDAGAL